MLSSMQQLVVGIFRNRAQVEQAINELHQIGFDNRHIWCAKHGISIGAMLKKTKNACNQGQNIATGGIYDDLVNMGIPPQDARYYESEFEAGHSIVAVLKSGVPLVATSILIRNGGYVVNKHFTQFTYLDPDTGGSVRTYVHFAKELFKLTQRMINRHLLASRPTSIQEPTTKKENTELSGTNEPVASSTDHEKSTELHGTNEDVASSTDKEKDNETQKIGKDLVNA